MTIPHPAPAAEVEQRRRHAATDATGYIWSAVFLLQHVDDVLAGCDPFFIALRTRIREARDALGETAAVLGRVGEGEGTKCQ